MSKVKFVCGNREAEINDSDKFCTGCGLELKQLSDAQRLIASKKMKVFINSKRELISNLIKSILKDNPDIEGKDAALALGEALIQNAGIFLSVSDTVEMTDEEFEAAHDALELIADADVKTKLRGSSVSQAMVKLKKALETSLFLREQSKKAKEELKGDPSNKDFLTKSLKDYKEKMKDADMLTNMWIDAIKEAMKVK